jgi:hypothetical protein
MLCHSYSCIIEKDFKFFIIYTVNTTHNSSEDEHTNEAKCIGERTQVTPDSCLFQKKYLNDRLIKSLPIS